MPALRALSNKKAIWEKPSISKTTKNSFGNIKLINIDKSLKG